MRVLHVLATSQRRGGEIFASDLIRALDERGVQQRALVLRSNAGDVGTENVPTIRLTQRGGMVPGLNVRVAAVRTLSKAIAQWEPDVVQAHGGEAFKHSVLATMRHRVPVVYRRIGTSPEWIRHGPKRLAHRALMRRAARVVAVADAVRSEAIHLFGVPAENVVTIPNGVDRGRLEPEVERGATRSALAIAPSVPVVLSVGALTWEKDPATHVEVGRRVLARFPDAVHVFVGDGPLRGEAQRLAMAGGVGERMMFLGSRRDVADILAAGDVLLMASRSDGMEGMPAIVIEAGMAGLPVAAYSVAGISEVVVDATSGLLACPGDIDGLTERLAALLLDPALRADMGAAGRERCRRCFDMESVAPMYLRVYEEVGGHP